MVNVLNILTYFDAVWVIISEKGREQRSARDLVRFKSVYSSESGAIKPLSRE